MSRTLTATDRSALIRLASTLPKGSEERKVILAGLLEAAAVSDYLVRFIRLLQSDRSKIRNAPQLEAAMDRWATEAQALLDEANQALESGSYDFDIRGFGVGLGKYVSRRHPDLTFDVKVSDQSRSRNRMITYTITFDPQVHWDTFGPDADPLRKARLALQKSIAMYCKSQGLRKGDPIGGVGYDVWETSEGLRVEVGFKSASSIRGPGARTVWSN